MPVKPPSRTASSERKSICLNKYITLNRFLNLILINPLLQHSLGLGQVTSSVFTGLLCLNPGEVDPGLQELVTTQAASVKPVIYNNNNNNSSVRYSTDKVDVWLSSTLSAWWSQRSEVRQQLPGHCWERTPAIRRGNKVREVLCMMRTAEKQNNESAYVFYIFVKEIRVGVEKSTDWTLVCSHFWTNWEGRTPD